MMMPTEEKFNASTGVKRCYDVSRFKAIIFIPIKTLQAINMDRV